MRKEKTAAWLVNNILFSYEGETHMGINSERKQHFLQHKGNRSNNKKAYTDGSKSTGRIVSFATVFADIIRRGALPEEASIHTAEITAMKDTKREDIRWVIYTDSLSSMLAIENNREENHSILNQIHDILAELQN